MRGQSALAFAGVLALAVAAIAVIVVLARDGEGDVPGFLPTLATAVSSASATAQPGVPATPTPAASATGAPPPGPTPHVQAVVSAHHLATDAGIAILEQGGTAADAAVAVAAVLSVVEPWFSSVLGGGTWALYFDAESGEVTALDGVGPTGSKATIADFARRAGQGGIHQSNVPGAWDGWMLWLEAYGTLDLGDILAPAIRIAREGYPVSPQMADWIGRSAIAARPATALIYAPNGRNLQEGETVYQYDLADTFEALVAAYDSRIAEGRSAAIQAARDYYYRGPLAEAIVRFSDTWGGYLTLGDFAGFEAAIVEPISIDYKDGLTVFQNPPNSQGITMLIALNILEGVQFSGAAMPGPGDLHLMIEALKLAFSDRHYHVGDPARIDVPVERLLSEAHADAQRARISPTQAMRWPISDGLADAQPVEEPVGGTTTFQVVDRYGNAASVTTSLGAQFLVVDGTGINMNNRMRFMSLTQGDANQMTPGFKVRHTSNPYMVFRDGQLYMLGGNTGVDTQTQGQVQQFIAVVEFGMTAQQAVDRPRFVDNSFPASTYPYAAPNTLDVEPGFPVNVIEDLRARGHTVRAGGDLFGNAGIIIVSDDGTDADIGVERRNETSSGVVIRP